MGLIEHPQGVVKTTPDHLVCMYGEQACKLAGDICSGEVLENATGSPVVVAGVRTAAFTGVYCPMTSSGYLIVDGIKVSCYTGVEIDGFVGKHLNIFLPHNSNPTSSCICCMLHRDGSQGLRGSCHRRAEQTRQQCMNG